MNVDLESWETKSRRLLRELEGASAARRRASTHAISAQKVADEATKHETRCRVACVEHMRSAINQVTAS